MTDAGCALALAREEHCGVHIRLLNRTVDLAVPAAHEAAGRNMNR